jgi:hypothetical protein
MQHEDVASQWFEQGDEADARETIAFVRRARLSDPLEPSPLPCWSASAVLHAAFMALVLMIPPMAAWDMFDAVEPAPVLDRLVSARVMPAPPALAPALPVDGEALLGDGQDPELGALAAGEGGQAGRTRAERERGQRREVRRPSAPPPKDLQETLNAVRASASDATSLDGALGQLRYAQTGDGVGQDGLGVSGAGRGGAGEEQSVGLAMLPRRPARKLGALGVLFDGNVVGSNDMVIVRGREAATLGCLTPGIVEGAVQRREPQLRACYQAALLRRPAQSGRLTLRLEIGPNGQPTVLEADSGAMRDPMLESCIEDQLATLRFPAFDQCASVIANFPLRFKPVAPRP